jgi:AcrR family transcriptional regulator
MGEPESIRARRRRETREAIFVAALEEYFAEGVAAARIERIVEKAGVARGTFYFHFPTKDHVLWELTDRNEGAIVDSTDLGDDAPLADVLRATFACIRTAMHAVTGPLRRELLAAQMRRPHAKEPTPLLAALAAAVSRAQRRGEVRADVAPLDVAATLLTAAFGTIALAPDDDAAGASLSLLVDMALRGVAAAPRPATRTASSNARSLEGTA